MTLSMSAQFVANPVEKSDEAELSIVAVGINLWPLAPKAHSSVRDAVTLGDAA